MKTFLRRRALLTTIFAAFIGGQSLARITPDFKVSASLVRKTTLTGRGNATVDLLRSLSFRTGEVAAANFSSGSGSTFSIPALPVIATTQAATNVTSTSARLSALIMDGGKLVNTRFRLHTNSSMVQNGIGGSIQAGGSVLGGEGPMGVFADYSSLSPGNTYYYRAEASEDNFDTYKQGAIMQLTTLPTAPTMLAATNASGDEFTVNWTPSTAYLVDGYRLDVATDNAFTNILPAYNNLLVSGKTTASYTVTGLEGSTQYWFRLRAENTGGYSDYSGTETMSTLAVGVSSITVASTVPTKASSVSFTVNFTINVSSLNSNAFGLITTGTAEGTIGTPTGSGRTWTVPVTGVSGDGTLRLDLTTLTGVVPNLTTTFTAGERYIIDNTRPNAPSQPTLRSQDDPGIDNSDHVTNKTIVTFTGTAEAGSTVTLYGTDGTTVLGTATASGGSYSITNTIAFSEGEHQVTAKATDQAGNQSVASTARTIIIDTTRPSLTISSSSYSLKAGETATITFEFSEDPGGALYWDGTDGDIVVSGGTLGTLNGSGTTRTAIFTPTANINTGSGSITTAAGVYADWAGNGLPSASLSPQISYDTYPPTTSISTVVFSDDTGTGGDFITRTATQTLSGTLSANLASGEIVQVSIDNGSNWSAATATAGQNTWSLSNVVLTASNTLQVAVSDAAGNHGPAKTAAYVLDTNLPTLTSVNISSNHTNPSLAKTGDLITLSFTSSETIQAPTVSIAGRSLLATGTGNNWSVSFTVAAEDADGTISFSIPLQDIAGNSGTAVTATTNSSSVKINRNANLSAISLSVGSLSPLFSPGTTSYNASVSHVHANIRVTPTSEDGASIQVRVNGGEYSSVSSGAASSLLTLNYGNNTIDVKVTAEDGVTVKTYTLTVTRPSTDATLSALSISSGTLSPAFSRLNESYTASVSNSTTSITVTPMANEANATIAVQVNNGGYASVASGSASGPLALNVGDNSIWVKVTAQNTTTTQIYEIIVTRPSTDATLSGLALSSGAVGPAFASETETYTASVSNSTTSITITPTANQANATIEVQVNGAGYTSVSSGSASAPLELNVGDNTIEVKVTAQDGSTFKTYTIVVNRISTDASLSALSISSGTLSPAFASGTETYSTSVSNSTSSITITPTANQANATIEVQVNGAGYTSVSSGGASAPLALNVGDNTIEVKVTAQDGSTVKAYTITVNRVSTDATLSALSISSGTLSPAFASGTATYSASVSNSTSSITVTPTANQANATIEVQVNGAGYTSVNSGSASAPLALNVGDNTIEVKVTAQDGSTFKTYTIVVNRISTDASLSALSLSSGTLSPTFASGTETYSASASNSTSSITITPTANQANATIEVQVNGAGYVSVNSGSASAPLALNVGDNTIEVKVTAQDGSMVKTYTITVNRISTDATLSALSISSGTLSPAFASGTETYTASVSNSTTSITITPTANQANATIEVQVNGAGYTSVNSGSASAPLALNVGDNTIEVKVTAHDGSTVKTYTITLNRAAALSTVADLSDLRLSTGSLTPSFIASTTNYAATVPYAITTLRLTPTVAQVNATIKINGGGVASGFASGEIGLNVGTNVITAEVTAQDGTTQKVYTLTVTRSAASALANLTSLTTSNGVWDKPFVGTVTSYNVYVNNAVAAVTVTAGAENVGSTIKVNGSAVQSQVPSGNINLAHGLNTVTILVTAEDATTTKPYTLNITRLPLGTEVPGQNGEVTAGDAVSDVIVTSPTQPVTVTIPAGTTSPTTVDYSNVVSGGSGTVPETTINSPLAKVEIPASTTVTGTSAAWTGTIAAPRVSDYEFPKVKGQTITKGLVIEVGDPNVSLTFTKAVRLVLYGQAGMRVARIHNKVYEEITAIGAADSQTEGDKLAPSAAFKINSGADLVVWTKGFSQFITFEQSVNLEEAVALADLAWLTSDKLIAASGSLGALTGPLTLPAGGPNGSSISWSSSNPAVVSHDGRTINRPAFGSGNVNVTLTATLRSGSATETASFAVTVLQLPNSAPTLNAISDHAICPTPILQNIPLSGISAGAEISQTTQLFVSTNNSTLFSSLAVAGGSGNSGVLSYILNPGASGTAIVTVTVRDNGGTADGGINSFSRSFTLSVNAPPVISISSSLGGEIDKGSSTVLTASGGASYTWATAAGIISGQSTASLTVRPAVTTTYTVTATSSTGCTATQSFTVRVADNLNTIKANNILSPNGDGQNDKLIFENLDLFPNHTLRIFDKAGRVLYLKRNYGNDWDGSFDGAPLAEDTYYYILDFGTQTGQKRGFVSIVR